MNNSGPTILIVEDEAAIALELAQQLRRTGFNVLTAIGSAEKAFKAIESNKPDVVLMDIRLLGEMDGIQAAKLVRQRYRIPVIFLTAHSDDDTLERARVSEPFGFVTKPFSIASVKAAIAIALYKHRTERELENHRQLLSTLLDSIPDAVCVADAQGEVLFLNRAAEALTGWRWEEAGGKKLAEVVRIEDGLGRAVCGELLERAIKEGRTVRLSSNSILLSKAGTAVEIAGRLAVASVRDRPGGVIMTLQDVTAQKEEESRLRQEQQMFVAGELALGVARQFHGLFDLLEETVLDSSFRSSPSDLQLADSALQIGKGMAQNLVGWHDAQGTANPLLVRHELLQMQLLLGRICGWQAEVAIVPSVDEDVAVLSTGSHFEQLLMNLVLDAKERIQGRGRIRVSAVPHAEQTQQSQSKAYVRITVRSEMDASPDDREAAEGGRNLKESFLEPGLNVIRAMAMAAGGFIRIYQPSESLTILDLYLPRYEGWRAGARDSAGVVFAIGLDARLCEAVKRGAGEGAVILESTTFEEAALTAGMFSREVDLLVVNGAGTPAKSVERVIDRLRTRWPGTFVLQVGGGDGWNAGTDLADPGALERRVNEIVGQTKKQRSLGASA